MSRVELDTFEATLLADLREEVARRSSMRPARRRAGRVVATLAFAASVALGASLGAFGGVGSQPAFAVERLRDGDVVVTITDWSRADDLERELVRQGVDAEVTYDASATHPSDLGDGTVPVRCSASDAVLVDHGEGSSVVFTLDSRFVKTFDRTLRITAAGGPPNHEWVAASVIWHGAGC